MTFDHDGNCDQNDDCSYEDLIVVMVMVIRMMMIVIKT